MRIAWLTDLHLDFLRPPRERFDFYNDILGEDPDAIFVTGDTGESDRLWQYIGELRDLSDKLYYIFGNHDFYGATFAEVRSKATSRTDKSNNEFYLPRSGPQELVEGVGVVGVDGWYDAQCGYSNSMVRLADWGGRGVIDLIGLSQKTFLDRAERLEKLGKDEAYKLEIQLNKVKTEHSDWKKLFVLCHVPPYPDACFYEGKKSEPDFLPFFTWVAGGKALTAFAEHNPSLQITVLCGHTHGKGEYRAHDNLLVKVGGWNPGEKSYGFPRIQEVIEL
jgi:Icc protein